MQAELKRWAWAFGAPKARLTKEADRRVLSYFLSRFTCFELAYWRRGATVCNLQYYTMASLVQNIAGIAKSSYLRERQTALRFLAKSRCIILSGSVSSNHQRICPYTPKYLTSSDGTEPSMYTASPKYMSALNGDVRYQSPEQHIWTKFYLRPSRTEAFVLLFIGTFEKLKYSIKRNPSSQKH